MKSKFSKSNFSVKEQQEIYSFAHNAVLNEALVLWQSSNVFLIANTILSAAIGLGFFNKKEALFQPDPTLAFLSIIGFIISILWWGSYRRTANYYKFRMAQATQREPDRWYLFVEDGKNFSKGDTIEIDGEEYNVGIGRFFKNHWVVTILATLFAILYLVVFFTTSPLGIYIRR